MADKNTHMGRHKHRQVLVSNTDTHRHTQRHTDTRRTRPRDSWVWIQSTAASTCTNAPKEGHGAAGMGLRDIERGCGGRL
jgi:hypothetical protein